MTNGTCSECGGTVIWIGMSIHPGWSCQKCGRFRPAGPVINMGKQPRPKHPNLPRPLWDRDDHQTWCLSTKDFS